MKAPHMLPQIVFPGKAVRTLGAPERCFRVTMFQLMTFKAVLKRKRRIAKPAFVGSRVHIYMATVEDKTVF
jgi:hypothetical protein